MAICILRPCRITAGAFYTHCKTMRRVTPLELDVFCISARLVFDETSILRRRRQLKAGESRRIISGWDTSGDKNNLYFIYQQRLLSYVFFIYFSRQILILRTKSSKIKNCGIFFEIFYSSIFIYKRKMFILTVLFQLNFVNSHIITKWIYHVLILKFCWFH